MHKNDQDFIIREIRTQYTEKEFSALDELRKLDKKAKLPAKIFAYILGCLGAVIMGGGMSLVMTDLGTTLDIPDAFTYGIIIGIIGLSMAVINYPIYKVILNNRKKKYSAKIIALSDKIIGSGQ